MVEKIDYNKVFETIRHSHGYVVVNAKYQTLHIHDVDGYESWAEYTDTGKECYFRNSLGYEQWKEYDEFDRPVYIKTNTGYEVRFTYDKHGDLIK